MLAAERYDGAEPVNLGTGVETSIRDLAETVAELTGFDGEIVWDTSKPNGQPRRSLDASRAEELFGFRARTALREGLERTVAWYREHAHSACRRLRRRRLPRPVVRGTGSVPDSTRSSSQPRGSVARPRTVLAALVAIQWLATLAFALTVRHNGWVFYQGGDQIWYTTTAWLLGDGVLAPTYVGFGWVDAARAARLAGRSRLRRLPAVRHRAAGARSRAGRACVRLRDRRPDRWQAARPLRRILLGSRAVPGDPVLPGRLPRPVRRAVPAPGARTDCARRLSVDGLLARRGRRCSCGRSTPRDWTWAALAGLAAGVGATIKPSNLLFLVGPALLLLLARRWRMVLPYAAGAVPSLVLLALWKQRGLGERAGVLPWRRRGSPPGPWSSGKRARPVRLARLGHLPPQHGEPARVRVQRPRAAVDPDRGCVRGRSPVAAARRAAGGLVRRVSAVQGNGAAGDGRQRQPLPAPDACLPGVLPALRVPPAADPRGRTAAQGGCAPAPAATHRPPHPGRRCRPLRCGAACCHRGSPAALGRGPEAVTINSILTPVDDAIHVTVTPDGARRTVTWTHPELDPTKVFYKVFRTEFQGEDVECGTTRSPECVLQMIELATTRDASYVDLSPPEDARYRIAIATNWEDNPAGGDVISISAPIAATP